MPPQAICSARDKVAEADEVAVIFFSSASAHLPACLSTRRTELCTVHKALLQSLATCRGTGTMQPWICAIICYHSTW